MTGFLMSLNLNEPIGFLTVGVSMGLGLVGNFEMIVGVGVRVGVVLGTAVGVADGLGEGVGDFVRVGDGVGAEVGGLGVGVLVADLMGNVLPTTPLA